jgi:hypothetical protein
MAPVPAPTGAPARPKMNPKQRRIMLAVGAAAVLALVFMLQARRGGTPAEATLVGTRPDEATFADNGEQAAALGTAVTDALYDQGDQITGALTEVATELAALREQPGAAAPPEPADTGDAPVPAAVLPVMAPAMTLAGSKQPAGGGAGRRLPNYGGPKKATPIATVPPQGMANAVKPPKRLKQKQPKPRKRR